MFVSKDSEGSPSSRAFRFLPVFCDKDIGPYFKLINKKTGQVFQKHEFKASWCHGGKFVKDDGKWQKNKIFWLEQSSFDSALRIITLDNYNLLEYDCHGNYEGR